MSKVLVHDDGKCKNGNRHTVLVGGFCPACGFHPDTQSTALINVAPGAAAHSHYLLKLQAAKVKAKAWQPKKLTDYTPAEREKLLADLYEMAAGELRALQTSERGQKDFDHFAYEAVMKLLGPDVFDAVNALDIDE